MNGSNTAKIDLDHQCVTEYIQEKEVKQPFKPLDEIPAFQQKKFKHGVKFEPVAKANTMML